ncbi:MAG TPA: VWA domain-containing protein [Vicinamibacterales bacterium]|nr:VWA domain-containing protein [Vicinamibacterales bacterium]
MTRFAAALIVALAATVGVASRPQTPQRPTFRAGTDVVTLTAFVRQGNLTVPGLTGSDFNVTDNGVRQTVTVIPGEAVPFDLTIVLDLSGSVECMLDDLKRQVREVAALLRPDDRLRLVTFSDKIVDIFGFLPGDADLPLEALRAGPLTPLYDSMAMTLMRVRPADRGQVVVLLTDGYDTSSTLTLNDVRDVALRSEDVFHLFIVHQSPVRVTECENLHTNANTRRFWWPEPADLVGGTPPTQVMGDIARTTGGEMSEIFEREHIPGDLKQAIEDFRASYILQYTVQGVDPKGRHKLAVKLNRPGDYNIRARREYEGG